MASQIARDKVFGNFRQRGAQKPARGNSERYKQRPGMSAAHLALIRQLPCCVTGRRPSGEAHHLKSAGGRGMGLRSLDRWTVPMAHEPHMEVERAGSRNEIAWFTAHGIDPLLLAEDLWLATGNLEAMVKIVTAHRSTST